jgi:hypothetical protein
MRVKFIFSACFVLTLVALGAVANASQQAYNPYPGDGAEDVPHNVCLTWSPGEEPCPPPLEFYVFFSTDYNQVANQDLSALVCGDTEVNECCVEDLCLGATYYWRVVAVCTCYTAEGDVWSFTVIDHIVVDDMESYEDGCGASAIWEFWKDGAGDCNGIGGNGSGSSVYLATDPVRGGAQSMEYWYDNFWEMHDLSWSEASLAFSEPQNWTALCANVLTLFFYGDPNNDADDTEQLYVALEDSDANYAEVRYPLQDMDDITVTEWQRWNIPLTDFNDVNLAGVEKLYIGFGERDSWALGGSGIVYFDDIRLYATVCIPEYGPVADFDGDCFVSLEDYAILASRWFMSPGSLSVDIAPEPPDDFVDWRDLGVLTDSWLQEQLWPPP